jgi:hypothetical protein
MSDLTGFGSIVRLLGDVLPNFDEPARMYELPPSGTTAPTRSPG